MTTQVVVFESKCGMTSQLASMTFWFIAWVGFLMCSVPRVVVGDRGRPVLRFNSEGTFKILQVIYLSALTFQNIKAAITVQYNRLIVPSCTCISFLTLKLRMWH